MSRWSLSSSVLAFSNICGRVLGSVVIVLLLSLCCLAGFRVGSLFIASVMTVLFTLVLSPFFIVLPDSASALYLSVSPL